MKKNNAVVFGATSDHLFAVACVMMDLKRKSPGLVDEVVVIHDGACEKDQRILASILPARFIAYDFPLNERRVLNSRSVRYFTKMVFSKFECLRLLDDYNNVMWMDYDMVIKDTVAELFLPCDTGIKMMPGGLPVRGQLHEPVGEYDMETEGICACIFVFQDTLKNYKEMYRFCYDKLEHYVEILYMPEQAIFDFMIQEFELKPAPIDGRVYSPHPSDTVSAVHAKIIHAYGQPKFWNGIHNDQWNNNYRDWQKMGGTAFKKSSFVRKVLKKARALLPPDWQ